MKEGVEAAGLRTHYMIQPLGYHTPDTNKQGFIDLPEFPFGKILVFNFRSELLSDIINAKGPRLDSIHSSFRNTDYGWEIAESEPINPKRAGGGQNPPLDIFCYISAGCYFFALKLDDFCPSSLAINLRPFFFKNRT